MSALQNLQDQVTILNTTVDSAVALINGLHTELVAVKAALEAGDNGAALQALTDELAVKASALAAAVAANTTPVV